jgi:DNA oxidative demethylase
MLQSSLFGNAPAAPARWPEGLRYEPGFITAAEERALCAEFAVLPFAPFEFQGWLGKRETVSFGWHYDFARGRLDAAPPLPDFLCPLRARAAAFAELAPEAFEQALVIRYGAGAGIGWHRDRPVFEEVVGISLLAPCQLRFRRRSGTRFQRLTLAAAPCSAYLLRGEVRREWEHSIPPVAALRYSVTFRSRKKP